MNTKGRGHVRRLYKDSYARLGLSRPLPGSSIIPNHAVDKYMLYCYPSYPKISMRYYVLTRSLLPDIVGSTAVS